MKKVTNESELSVGASSIRNKYKGAHGDKSKINYAVVKETTKKVSTSNSGPKGVSEEKVIIKKESQSSRIISGSPIETSSKITTKTVIQGGDTGSSRQKITITKTETTEKSKNSRALSGQKGKELAISERIETSSTSNNNPNGNQRGRIKQEITTKTTTTTTNQTGRGQSSGKQEIVKTVTNTTAENTNTQKRSRRGKEEITTKTTTTTNQRSDSQSKGGSGQRIEKTVTQSQNQTQRQNTRGRSQGQKEQVVKEVTTSTSVNRRNEAGQKQVTTTKKVITANTNQNKNELTTSKTSQINVSENKGRTGLRSSQQQQQEQTTSTTTKQRILIAQKSTPALRGNKETTSNSTKKEKRAYSSNTEINSSRDNITRITIDDTGKIPKKTYVLNVRKLDRIQQNKRQRLTYSSKLEETNPITTNFNHNIIVIKNVTRELPTLSDIGEDGKLIHKFAYTSKTNIPNTVRKVIDESGKKPKKKPVVSPRKNEVIKTIKKPFKFTYENYTETNNSFNAGVKKIPLPTTSKSIKDKINAGELKSNRTNETKTSRIKMEGNEKTMTTTTNTTTTETKSRIGRNKSEANINKGGEKGSKITITKTEISTENQGGRNGKLQISRSGRNISENSGSTTEKKTTKVRESSKGGNKVETVTTEQVITQSSGKGRLGGGESDYSKITTVKKTEMTVSSQGDNSGRSRSRTKQETSSTTTTTTTKTVTKTSSSKEEAVKGGGVVKKFRAIKKVKK